MFPCLLLFTKQKRILMRSKAGFFRHSVPTVLLTSDRYSDEMPLLRLCVQAQQFYKKRSINTKVKACATLSVDEILQLAGVDALTIMPEDIQNLQKGTGCIRLVENQSLFGDNSIADDSDYPSYLDDESTYRLDFSRNGQGKGQYKLMQVRVSDQARSSPF